MFSQRAPWWIYVVAISFLGYFAFVPYLWVYGPADTEGLDARFLGNATEIRGVKPGSEVDRAGLGAGDLVLAIDGQSVGTAQDWASVKANMEVGKVQRWEIARGDERHVLEFIPQKVKWNSQISLALLYYNLGISGCYLALGLFIALRRPHDSVARVGSWFILTASVAFGMPIGWAATWRHLPAIAQILLWIPQLSRFIVEGIFLTFTVIFPRRIFRARWPWLLIWLPVLATLPWRVAGIYSVIHFPGHVTRAPEWIFQVISIRIIAYLIAGMGLLAVNYRRLADLNERRRLRVLILGIVVSLASAIVMVWSIHAQGIFMSFGFPFFILALTLTCPLAFTYSILRHRAFDIQVIIRQGLQYALARRAVLGLVPALAAMLIVDLAINSRQPLVVILRSRGWVYALLGGLAVLIYARRRQWLESLDRRFFRDRYNAQRLLREIVEEIRQARAFERVAPRVAARIEAALHPEFVALMARQPNEPSYHCVAAAPPQQDLPLLAADSKLIALMRLLGKPLEMLLADSGWLEQRLPRMETEIVRRERIDLLVPVATGKGCTEALLLLGIKRSEEPYTREDQELLEAIATSLGLLLEQPAPKPEGTTQTFQECPECGTCYDPGAVRGACGCADLTPIPLPRLLAGRYRLERRLGRGGMGTVYEATDSSLERRVAVKVMRHEIMESPSAAARFHREALAAAGFTHPNVVTVHDFGVEQGTSAFLVMELLEGSTLRDELRRLKRLDPARSVQILRAVCAAVDAAHHRQLIHRDLKPENIFLARNQAGEASEETVKVLDFGLAKFVPVVDAAAETRSFDTAAGLLVGTAAYMSPEQLLGEDVSASWDLWALTVVAYEILTGALPFATASGGDWRHEVLTGSFTPVSEHLPQAPDRWQQFFARAFAVSLAERPASTREFMSRLEDAVLDPGALCMQPHE
jgi:eukaryotic-like serine/threonine-protein kinase